MKQLLLRLQLHGFSCVFPSSGMTTYYRVSSETYPNYACWQQNAFASVSSNPISQYTQAQGCSSDDASLRPEFSMPSSRDFSGSPAAAQGSQIHSAAASTTSSAEKVPEGEETVKTMIRRSKQEKIQCCSLISCGVLAFRHVYFNDMMFVVVVP